MDSLIFVALSVFLYILFLPVLFYILTFNVMYCCIMIYLLGSLCFLHSFYCDLNIVVTLVFLNQYVEKSLIIREEDIPENPSVSIRIWQAVQAVNVREVYRLIVTSTSNLINTKYYDESHHAADAKGHQHDPEACLRVEETTETERCFRGWSLLHLACHSGSALMVELLLQFGADVNMCDYHERTPLHHCITSGKNQLAKFLLRR